MFYYTEVRGWFLPKILKLRLNLSKLCFFSGHYRTLPSLASLTTRGSRGQQIPMRVFQILSTFLCSESNNNLWDGRLFWIVSFSRTVCLVFYRFFGGCCRRLIIRRLTTEFTTDCSYSMLTVSWAIPLHWLIDWLIDWLSDGTKFSRWDELIT